MVLLSHLLGHSPILIIQIHSQDCTCALLPAARSFSLQINTVHTLLFHKFLPARSRWHLVSSLSLQSTASHRSPPHRKHAARDGLHLLRPVFRSVHLHPSPPATHSTAPSPHPSWLGPVRCCTAGLKHQVITAALTASEPHLWHRPGEKGVSMPDHSWWLAGSDWVFASFGAPRKYLLGSADTVERSSLRIPIITSIPKRMRCVQIKYEGVEPLALRLVILWGPWKSSQTLY